RFYYSDNNLVKYEIRIFNKAEIKKSEINFIAYFENESLIKFQSDKETEINTLEIIKNSKQLILSYIDFLKPN
ncbi:hypothetical protein, partial [Flavobacterium filum]|uniref:hypothetical protein n=1 Tax=Flavobacterium filum TaxID=370974 RepID=UPI0023F3A6B6